MAAQAISLTEPTLGHLRMGTGTSAVYQVIRGELPAMLEGDRWLHDDIKTVSRLVRSGLALAAAHTACSSGFGDNP
jgi:histidine ammonia-lyase